MIFESSEKKSSDKHVRGNLNKREWNKYFLFCAALGFISNKKQYIYFLSVDRIKKLLNLFL